MESGGRKQGSALLTNGEKEGGGEVQKGGKVRRGHGQWSVVE